MEGDVECQKCCVLKTVTICPFIIHITTLTVIIMLFNKGNGRESYTSRADQHTATDSILDA